MDEFAPAVDDMGFLQYIADQNGIATTYWDWYGKQRNVSSRTLLHVLNSLGVPLDQDARIRDLHKAKQWTEDRPWRQMLPPTVVVREGQSVHIPVHVNHGDWVHVSYRLEDGSKGSLHQVDHYVPPRTIDGVLTGRATFEVPNHLPLGWHTLSATAEDGRQCEATLIVVPQRLNPPALSEGKRHWGVQLQMYSTRSKASWGMGDAYDLADLVSIAGQNGADFALINPVHAQAPVSPIENSPYLPVTRRWVNPIYIRPEAIEEFRGASTELRAKVEKLRVSALVPDAAPIDRDKTWAAKLAALELIYTLPRSIHRQAAFDAFVARGGEDLKSFALWSAIAEAEGTVTFPEDLASAHASGVEKARVKYADRLEFWQWLQWIAREQMIQAHEAARAVGMRMGLMADLAVGVHPEGSEKWGEPEIFAPAIHVGAPPDMYSQQGQDWSQPPWNPRSLAEVGYRPLRDMLRAVLAHAGAIRIDHILGLFRLWWIPEGGPASEGTYVYFDHEAMVGVVLLEAARAGAVVIGEDLGTVEPWVRDYLASRGILGTSVVWFEKEGSGWPMHAGEYRWGALSTVNTHDLPPTAGYLKGIQTTLRDKLGLLVEDIEAIRAADAEEISQMCVRLREYGFLPQQEPTTEDVVLALHRYVAATPSALIGVSLVDAVGDERPQNLPGTDQPQYPNWRMPLTDGSGHEVYIEDLAESARLKRLFAVVDESLS